MLEIQKMVEEARYSDNLESVIRNLEGKEVLRLVYESSWQGDVDIDVLLEDGRVFSYYYAYGSCSGCDEWEHKALTDEQIEQEMVFESTIFNNIEQYKEWRKRVAEKK